MLERDTDINIFLILTYTAPENILKGNKIDISVQTRSIAYINYLRIRLTNTPRFWSCLGPYI